MDEGGREKKWMREREKVDVRLRKRESGESEDG